MGFHIRIRKKVDKQLSFLVGRTLEGVQIEGSAMNGQSI
jgi:hypothetical protein